MAKKRKRIVCAVKTRNCCWVRLVAPNGRILLASETLDNWSYCKKAAKRLADDAGYEYRELKY